MDNSVVEEQLVFERVRGKSYLRFLAEMHEAIKPDWYFEIGTNTGLSAEQSKSKSVCVDPEFILKRNIWSNKPQLHLYQETSDAFFAAGHLDRLGARFDLAFLDGMHWFDFLLRDFINAERYMTSDGIIVLHDCVPWTANMTLRDRSKVNGSAWTGDVWKVVPVLQQYRPDLSVRIFDAAPTGLVVVSGLDPKNTALTENYDAIIAAFDAKDDLAGYLEGLTIESSESSPWAKPN